MSRNARKEKVERTKGIDCKLPQGPLGMYFRPPVNEEGDCSTLREDITPSDESQVNTRQGRFGLLQIALLSHGRSY